VVDAAGHAERPAGIAGVAAAVLRALGLEEAPAAGERPQASLPYSAEEEARVAERLRALGYLE
jgi:hypothetical protein